MSAHFAPGTMVVVYLGAPREKIWGVLRTLDGMGITIEGIDLRSFDECLRGVAAKEIHPADISLAFFPIGRVEKILVDRGSDDVPSMEEQFTSRVGVGLAQFLARGEPKRRS
ncbi:MAG TPA: hypothetical protein VE404_07675 [Verrucomicrobiae bacterium]|nr:hypothetical protein [Verrucomicrobiae bacterium]